VKAGWKVKPLGEVCRIELGSTPSRGRASFWDTKRQTENVWLSIADLPQTLHGIAMDSKEYVSDAAAANMRLVPSGTLLASFKLTLGRLAYAGRDLYTNEAIAALYDIDEREISKRFLYWALTYFELPPENRTVTEATI
jgi:type I restriction enzyme S subunit